MIAIGVLVPIDPRLPAPPPEERPVGRAALLLREEGVRVIFGDRAEAGRLSGVEAAPGRWLPAQGVPVLAVHDRYPSQVRADRFAAIRAGLGAVPLGNPLALTLLCRDKLLCQHFLEERLEEGRIAGGRVSMPPVEANPAAFDLRLGEWGTAFLKPRYGALGASVSRVRSGDVLPARVPGVVPGVDDPSILQRAVAPPDGWAGRSVRVLCQRVPDGGWWLDAPVLRQSRQDPVVNAARGAEVAVADDVLDVDLAREVRRAALACCEALALHPEGRLLVEIGVDLVLGADDRPHLIEVNSRPRGRLEVLASLDPDRFAAAHVEACARPLRYLGALARSGDLSL